MRGISTRSVHAGEDPFSTKHGDVVAPIHMAVTFAKRRVDEVDSGYVYSRTSNPTRDMLEEKLASLENARYALAFSSGLAAETTVLLATVPAGGHIVAFDDLYGGTKRLFRILTEQYGVRVTYVDARRPEEVERAMEGDTRVVWIETPTNPLLKLADIREISRIASERGAILVVDNTFATPVFQRPLEMGADIVLHSATKYISGHSDVVAGAVMLNDPSLYDRLRFLQNALGTGLHPFESWLVMRGIKTLPIRMQRHQENAIRIAEYLEGHSLVSRVLYPGLPSHPQHELARRQMTGYSGMLSFEVRGGLVAASRLVESLRFFRLAESLGGVESLVEIPALMTHASIPREERLRSGITDGLIRLSVGIEDAEDLIDDLRRALDGLRP